MVVVRVAQRQLTLMLKEDSYDDRVSNTKNSEWRVKVTSSQSRMSLCSGDTFQRGRLKRGRNWGKKFMMDAL